MADGGSGQRERVAKARKPAYPRWSKAFLAHLATTSNVRASAAVAGVSTGKAYETRRGNPDFNRQWQQALFEGYEHLEMELLHRLRSGETKRAASAKFDNATAFRLLAAHRESIARQRAIQDDEDEEAVLASIDAKLERMRHRQLAAPGEDTDAE